VKILGVGAHPDDVELMCSGTLARLAERGHSIAVCSVTGGEYGSKTLGPDEVRPIRIREGEAAAAVLNGKFYCAEGWDKHFIFFNEEVRNRLCEIFRKVAPDVLFAPSPKDYVLDHDFSSLLARDCATAATVPTFVTGSYPPSPPAPRIPYLYYCEPVWHMDIFGNPVPSTTYVDITAVMEKKRQMLACHVSQAGFMPKHFGAATDLLAMFEPWGRDNGRIAGCTYAEAFRQHVAPPFPNDNILVELIGAKFIRAQ
jgi:N-acetylglucosamine malate deacetylase 1